MRKLLLFLLMAVSAMAVTTNPKLAITDINAASASAAMVQNTRYKYTLTANLTASSFTGTTEGSTIDIFLIGCDGTHTFTFPSSKRAGYPDSPAYTVITPAPGNHDFTFRYVGSTWYLTDTSTFSNSVAAALGNATNAASGIVVLDSSGNITVPGGIITTGSGNAGFWNPGVGTTNTPAANSALIEAPTSIPTAYKWILPTAIPANNSIFTWTVSGNVATIVPSTSPNIGTATGTSLNGNTFTAGTYTLTGAAGKTLTFSNSITFAGTDGTTMTFPSTPATLARTDAANTFAGTQTFSNNLVATAGTNSIAALVDSVDGTTPLNNINQTIASGTAYTLTATSAAVTFGTTSPILTFANAGTYWVSCDIQYSYVGATFAANRQFDAKIRRTNNTAADVAGSIFSEFVPTLTTITDVGPHTHIGPVLYTTAGTTDTLQVFADISVLPTAGTVTVTNCTITSMRAF